MTLTSGLYLHYITYIFKLRTPKPGAKLCRVLKFKPYFCPYLPTGFSSSTQLLALDHMSTRHNSTWFQSLNHNAFTKAWVQFRGSTGLQCLIHKCLFYPTRQKCYSAKNISTHSQEIWMIKQQTQQAITRGPFFSRSQKKDWGSNMSYHQLWLR